MVFAFVSGIINKFYNKWHQELFKEDIDEVSLNYSDLIEFKGPLTRNAHRTVKEK